MIRNRLALLVAAAIAALAPCAFAQPRHVYLTFQREDPATAITVNYQMMTPSDVSEVFYDTQSPKTGNPTHYRFHAEGRRHTIKGLADGRSVHWVELTSLEPGATYHFIAGDAKGGYSAEMSFRTVPRDAAKFRFVTGGDMGAGEAPAKLIAEAAKLDPAFVLVGGDIAYTNGDLKNIAGEDAWFDNWVKNAVAPDGRTIPIALAIGNHEVKGGIGTKLDSAPFYFGWFAQELGRSYFSRRFGANTVVLFLDSGHITPHAMQAEWMRGALQGAAGIRHKFAIYHVPLYPAHRDYTGMGSAMGRRIWRPIFDEFGMETCFENHDHVYKRTKLLKGDQVDPSGTLYLGDGCFGKGGRTVDKERRWYEEKAAAIQHFWLVDIIGDRAEYRAVSTDGKVFDVYPPDAAGAADAEKTYQILTGLAAGL